jgi:hypothetical protein
MANGKVETEQNHYQPTQPQRKLPINIWLAVLFVVVILTILLTQGQGLSREAFGSGSKPVPEPTSLTKTIKRIFCEEICTPGTINIFPDYALFIPEGFTNSFKLEPDKEKLVRQAFQFEGLYTGNHETEIGKSVSKFSYRVARFNT